MINELLTWSAFILNVVGNILLARKKESGWWIRLAPNVLWFIFAVNIRSSAMLANSVTFFGINLYGIWKWRKVKIHD